MKISVILGHPYKKSFNHAIAQTVMKTLINNNHEVYYHDLYMEGFDAIVTPQELSGEKYYNELINQHQSEIKEADGIIIVHPNWWGQPPAILKGWIDRVLWNKIAYEFEEGDSGGGIPKGLLKAKSALVFNTSNTPADREANVFGDPLESIWKNCVFDFCGVKEFYRIMFRVIDDSTEKQRGAWLGEVSCIVNKFYPACQV